METAQRRVEQQHYAIRKRTLQYDDVMNKQRAIVYELRGTILNGNPETVHGTILDVFNDLILTQCERYLSDPKNPGLDDFNSWLGVTFPVTVSEEELKPFLGEPAKSAELVFERVREAYDGKCAMEDQAVLPYMERGVFLNCIDRQWQDYLRAMDDLRHGVSLRSYGQRDPLVEYKREAFNMFENLMNSIKTEVANLEFRATTASNMRRMMAASDASRGRIRTSGGESALESTLGGRQASPQARVPSAEGAQQPKSVNDVFASMINQVGGRRMPQVQGGPPQTARPAASPAVGRNDPCPCGSGKKYKKCCGRSQF